MELRFPDPQGLADLGAFVRRAKVADEEGAIRLQASGPVLAAYVSMLPGSGLMGEGAVLGLRVMGLAEPVEVDATVPLAAVLDRLARDAGTTLPVPPTTVRVPWAALSPPRQGWERVGAVSADEINAVARQGISEIAGGAPPEAGGHAVTALRRQVWGRASATTPPVPAGGAFAAYALGFSQPGTEVTVWAHGRWTRLSTPAGHVLLR
jgi:hypothetical protein